MTKKHFNALAVELASVRPDCIGDERMRQWENDVTVVARTCEQFNPLFDRTRFWNAINKLADERAAELAERL